MVIYLIGYMGSGKTKLGKKLAARIGFKFIDLDKLFEQQHHTTIADYFNSYGEESFRKEEQQILYSMEKTSKAVVSTGGGTPCYQDNIAFMNKTGVTVYLQLSAQSLAHRLRVSSANRPLLENIGDEHFDSFIQQHLAERENYYLKAHFVVKGEDLTGEMLYKALNSILPS
ncbi:MAG: shikimate kinase [Bacteroidales bacterium]|nr:shikimate kinase [Bacteroidales bacterium]